MSLNPNFLSSLFFFLFFFLGTHLGFTSSISFSIARAFQAFYLAKEWVDQALAQAKEEESQRFAVDKAQAQSEKKAKETLKRLTESEKAKKSVEPTLAGFERQAKEQCGQL